MRSVCGCPIISDADSYYFCSGWHSRYPDACQCPCLMHLVCLCYGVSYPTYPVSLCTHLQYTLNNAGVWNCQNSQGWDSNELPKAAGSDMERYTVSVLGLESAYRSKGKFCLYNMLAQDTSAVQVRTCFENGDMRTSKGACRCKCGRAATARASIDQHVHPAQPYHVWKADQFEGILQRQSSELCTKHMRQQLTWTSWVEATWPELHNAWCTGIALCAISIYCNAFL